MSAGQGAAGRDPLDFSRASGQIFPSAIINETLRRQLGAEVGDALLLSFRTHDNIPDDTLLGNKENREAFGSVRTTIVAVIPDAGIGRFGLAPHQAFPSNAYVALEDLQGALDQEGDVNAVFVARAAPQRIRRDGRLEIIPLPEPTDARLTSIESSSGLV